MILPNTFHALLDHWGEWKRCLVRLSLIAPGLGGAEACLRPGLQCIVCLVNVGGFPGENMCHLRSPIVSS